MKIILSSIFNNEIIPDKNFPDYSITLSIAFYIAMQPISSSHPIQVKSDRFQSYNSYIYICHFR